MGGELVAGEKTWLEVVKAAANVEQDDLYVEELYPYPSTIKPAWVRHLNDSKDKNDVQSRSSELLNALSLTEEDALQPSQAFLSFLKKEEQIVVKDLKRILERSNGLSKSSFLEVLGPYLLSLKARQEESIPAKGKPSERQSNGVIDLKDEESTLRLLKDSSRFLGQRLVTLILECCISLNFWAPVQVLLERRVVVRNSSSKLVQSLVEDEQPLILCLYITNVPDLSPEDIYSSLTFFLDSTVKPSRYFQLVRKEWRSVAQAEIDKAAKGKDAIQTATENSMFHKLEKLSTRHDSSVSSAIGLAMAVDGFSSPELCIHYLLASGQDEGVLSFVVSQLNTLQVLKLTQYLGKWIEQYSSYLENFPAPKNGRVPSLPQVLSWACVVLEGHFTQLVLSADFHSELKSMRGLVESLVAIGTNISPLGGITEHIKLQRSLPVQKQQGGGGSDYVIELLDMS